MSDVCTDHQHTSTDRVTLPIAKGYVFKIFDYGCINQFIIYMTKLLQSDWLRGVQLFH